MSSFFSSQSYQYDPKTGTNKMLPAKSRFDTLAEKGKVTFGKTKDNLTKSISSTKESLLNISEQTMDEIAKLSDLANNYSGIQKTQLKFFIQLLKDGKNISENDKEYFKTLIGNFRSKTSHSPEIHKVRETTANLLESILINNNGNITGGKRRNKKITKKRKPCKKLRKTITTRTKRNQ